VVENLRNHELQQYLDYLRRKRVSWGLVHDSWPLGSLTSGRLLLAATWRGVWPSPFLKLISWKRVCSSSANRRVASRRVEASHCAERSEAKRGAFLMDQGGGERAKELRIMLV